MSENKNQQLALFAQGGIIGEQAAKVFDQLQTKNSKGEFNGTSMRAKPRKEIATNLNLKGKGNSVALEAAIMAERDAMFESALAYLLTLKSKGFTFGRSRSTTLTNGVEQFTLVSQKLPRNTGPSAEAMAKALGLTVEEVKELMAEMAKKNQVTDIPAKPAPQTKQQSERPGSLGRALLLSYENS